MINSHDKGKSFEYEIRDTLKVIDSKVRRSIMSGAIGNMLQSEQGDISNNVNLVIECKRTEKLKPYEFYQQAKDSNKTNGISIVAMRSNNKDSLALLSWGDFIMIYQSAIQNGLLLKQVHPKPQKPRKLTLDETKDLPFSKAKQVKRKEKTK